MKCSYVLIHFSYFVGTSWPIFAKIQKRAYAQKSSRTAYATGRRGWDLLRPTGYLHPPLPRTMPAEMGGAREQLSALQAAVLEARSLRHDGPLASREFSDRKKSLDPKKKYLATPCYTYPYTSTFENPHFGNSQISTNWKFSTWFREIPMKFPSDPVRKNDTRRNGHRLAKLQNSTSIYLALQIYLKKFC